MEKNSINGKDLKLCSVRIKLLSKALNKEETTPNPGKRVNRRQISHDFTNLGLKNFLPKNISFSPLTRLSDLKTASNTYEKRKVSKDAEMRVKEIIAKFNVKKISVIHN